MPWSYFPLPARWFRFYIAVFFFFFNDTATTEIYTLSLHDALPILHYHRSVALAGAERGVEPALEAAAARSEEHTSELQSQSNLVCRLLLEKKKTILSDSLPISGRSLTSGSPRSDLGITQPAPRELY